MAFPRWIADLFLTLFATTAERTYRQLCRTRSILTDQEFCETFYPANEISFDTCRRVRKVLKTQLRMANVRPDENIETIFEDIELADICFELGEEFGLQFPDEIVNNMDGTVDSLIRTTERLRSNATQPNNLSSN